MSKNLGGWIHSFTVTDTVTHKNGYTIYKITSIVFPRSIPEALTCITVWKRFHEIKKLYRDLLKRHKTLQLRGKIPEPKKANNYFKRFDPEIINIRKSYILELLDFVGQHPALYKSNIFLNFFENGQTPNTSPNHRNSNNNNNNNTDGINKYCNYLPQHEKQKKLKAESNIEAICDSLDLNYDNDINLIDPSKDKENDDENIEIEINRTKVEINDNVKELKNISDNNKNDELQQNNIEFSLKNEKSNCNNNNNNNRLSLIPTISFDGDNNDYIYEAALEFSQAVQSEVNQDYRIAYEKYKSGVDKLLTGSKDDSNEERKFIAKAKVTKYMNRAEELYEKYLLNTEDNKKTVQLSIDITDSTKELYLERPWNQLSKFKVIQIIDNVMQVQDITNKMLYIMKSIEKPPSITSSSSISYKKFSNLNSSNYYNDDIRTIFLPQDVPYMVKLLGFFQSDIKIYLLLQQAKGGKLFDYIENYKSIDYHIKTTTTATAISLNEIFTEIKNSNENTNNIKTMQNEENTQNQKQLIINYDSSFIELINEYKKSNNSHDDNNDVKKDNHFKNTNVNKISNKTTANIFNNHKDDNDVNDSNNINDFKNYVPSFDILSEDMDVNDLVSCSQKLLKSVSNTLELFKDTKIDNNDVNTLKLIENKIINIDNDSENDSNDSNSKINTNEILPPSSMSSLSSEINDIKTKSSEIMQIHMNRHYVIPEVSIKQWARELVAAVDSLHQKGVILGDLRPDNLLLGSKGQLLLSYFYQNECTDNSNSRNYINFLATENLYVAPERPLTIKSDWWSFGVILFELLTGYTFKLCHPGNLSCYFDIQYPDDINISLTAKDLLNRTIQYNPEHRIGINEIKIHKFFDGTKWDDIIERGINSF